MLTLILICVPVGLVAWMLCAPLTIRGDSSIPELQLSWLGIGSVKIGAEEGKGFIRVSTVFYRISRPMGGRAGRDKKKVRKKRSHRKIPGNFSGRVFRVLATLKLIFLHVAIDTGDPTKTALLFPLNFISLPRNYKVSVNFWGERYVKFAVRGVPARILWAWFV